MITKDQLKLTWEEFLSIVEKQEEEFLKKRAGFDPQFRGSKVFMRFPLLSKLVDPEYISKLKELYLSNGWSSVRVWFAENNMGITELTVELLF